MATLPLNADCFQANDSANPHYRRACDGIVNPRYQLLPAKMRLFRFGHTVDRRNGNNVPAVVNQTSPWWFSEAVFRTFLVAPTGGAARSGFVIDPSDAGTGASGFDSFGQNALVRTRLAVVHQFGQADRILEVVLTADLGCFTGKGKPISEDPVTGALVPLITEGVTTWFADPDVMQLYIPGLRTASGGRSTVAIEAMRIVKDRPAHEFFIF
ncbi:MAG: hypothetical protein AVDCRST_MAG27-3885 [uncultured Craurococcus sp.]|uniref:Uncharacterized protein n=1 Tax=uncultured Craurococcus sp. TaxID=1135998 RepID=A0A6J4JHI5_9PROT|nr:MAG: hypothetical protein AVDCRST_MAG27-3885 [uncultured Craurococcus sp.]